MVEIHGILCYQRKIIIIKESRLILITLVVAKRFQTDILIC